MKDVIKNVVRRSFVYKRLTNPIYRARARMFDLKHRVDTAREVKLSELRIDSPNLASGVYYAGTDAKYFKKFLINWDISFEDFIFVDLGSGKGRALLIASEHPFKRIVGVEFSSELNEIAKRNIARYKSSGQRCKNIEAICQDAATFSIPPEPAVFYMFNPFRREVVSKVLKNIEDSYSKFPREIYIFYANAIHDEVIKQSPIFTQIGFDDWHSMFKAKFG